MPKQRVDYPETITIRVTKEQKEFLLKIANYSDLLRNIISSIIKKGKKG